MNSSQHSTPPRPCSQSASELSSSTTVASDSISRVSDQTPMSAAISTKSSPSRRKSSERWHGPSQSVSRSRSLRGPTIWRWMLVVFVLILSIQLWHHLAQYDILSSLPSVWAKDKNLQETLRPVDSRGTKSKKKHDTVRWLEEHLSPNDHLPNSYTSRPRAAIISLVRNEELDGILQSMRQLEFHWNRNYRYPWIFFSETPFNDKFKVWTSHL